MTEYKKEKENRRFKNREKREEAMQEFKAELEGIVNAFSAKVVKKASKESSSASSTSLTPSASSLAQESKGEKEASLNSSHKAEEKVKQKAKKKLRKPKLDPRIIELANQKQEEKAQSAADRQSLGEVNHNFDKYFLDQRLLANLYQNEFIKATDIQNKAINAILDGNDVFASAETGTGKTLAYLVPSIQYLLDFPSRNQLCRVLIVAPTRDLVLQIVEHAKVLTANLNINVGYLIGKLADIKEKVDSQEEKEKAFAVTMDNQIVVATPGRIAEELLHNLELPALKYLIVDEVDRVLEIGLGKDIRTITKNTANREHTMFFSATTDEASAELFAEVAPEGIHLEGSHSRAEKNKLTQYYYHADSVEHKIQLLANIIKENNWQKVMVFVKKKETVTKVYKALSNMRIGIRCTQIDGDMDQEARSRALGLFTSGKVQVIVTTDLLARGIDIDNVKAVVNFDLPFDGDSFVHRVGRTGRMGQKGIAVSLVEGHDYHLLGKAMRYMREIIPMKVFPGLEPKTSPPANAFTPKAKPKKKKDKEKKKEKVKIKVRAKDKKNKGFPKKFQKDN